jgi:trigger factor
VLDALLAATDVPVPQSLVEAEVHNHLESENRLEDDEHRGEVTEEATKALRTQLLLDAIVEKEKVQVNQGELIEYLVATAPRYGMDPNAFAQAVDEAGQIPAMVAEVARRKALAVVLEGATVTDASGNVVNIDDLVPGRAAAAAAEAVAQAAGEAGEATDDEATGDEPPAIDDPTSIRI